MSAKIFAVTNRQLCSENFLDRIEKLAQTALDGIVLREKDLPESEYRALAREVADICRQYGKECILHFYPEAALRLGVTKIQLPLWKARGYPQLSSFEKVGISVHSVEEAKAAQALGASYVTVGHVFATDCKRDLTPRGLEFVRVVCGSIAVPVFAIGGIGENNSKSVVDAGADGICLMSSLMTCIEPKTYVERLRSSL